MVNDIPKVSFSMKNGYYWHPELKVNSNSKYATKYDERKNEFDSYYDFDEKFLPDKVPKYDGSGLNPALRILYLPCLDESSKPMREDVVPKEEYVRLNATVEDVFNSGGYYYNWSYKCDVLGKTDYYRKIEFCNSDVCYVGPDVLSILCPTDSNIVFRLEVYDGISAGFENNTYRFRQCLSCRPCCVSENLVSSTEDLPNYMYEHSPRDDADFDVVQSGNKFVYGTSDGFFALSNVILNSDKYLDMMNWLKYDSSNSDTGLAYTAMTPEMKQNFFELSSVASSGSHIFKNPFKKQSYASDKYTFNVDNSGFVGGYSDSYDSFRPFRVCVLNSFATDVDYGKKHSFLLDTDLLYHTALLYNHPSCNGLNSFSDLKNLRFGEDYVSEPILNLVVTSNPMHFDNCRTFGETNAN